MYSNFIQRLFSSIFILFFTLGIIFSKFNVILFSILIFALSYEWFFFCFSDEKYKNWRFLIPYLIIFIFIIFPNDLNLLFKIISFSIMILYVENKLMLIFGIIYFNAFIKSGMNLIEFSNGIYLLLLIIISFASDIGGYTFGKLMNGKNIIPSLSPNKTTYGFLGSIIFPILLLLLVSIFYNFILFSKYIIFVTFYSIVAIYGDLIISTLKRLVNLKDSGNILPGHGGLLDRIDSVMLVLIISNIIDHLQL